VPLSMNLTSAIQFRVRRARRTSSLSSWKDAAALNEGRRYAFKRVDANDGVEMAVARIGKCTMGSLTPAEESLLLATASRILPTHADLVVSNLCGSTSAEISILSQRDCVLPGSQRLAQATTRCAVAAADREGSGTVVDLRALP
jgi:hypothetical protein